jgi:hypothetical protein
MKKERKIEVTEKRARRIKRLVDDLTGMRGYWKLKKESLYRASC